MRSDARRKSFTMTTRFNWCASCGFTLAADDLPPIGATVAAAVVYTNAVNPSYPLPVVRLGIGLRRVSQEHCVSIGDGKPVPVSAIVAWMPSSRSGGRTAWPVLQRGIA